jgi:hypothetical protein
LIAAGMTRTPEREKSCFLATSSSTSYSSYRPTTNTKGLPDQGSYICAEILQLQTLMNFRDSRVLNRLLPEDLETEYSGAVAAGRSPPPLRLNIAAGADLQQ